jgi:hypothetical protein
MERRTALRGLATVVTAGALVCVGAPAASAATLVADYRFNDTRGSSVGSPPALTDIDTDPAADNVFATEAVGGSQRRVLRFPQGNGLQASTGDVIPISSYTIVVLFRFDAVGGYRRIIDFKNGSSDTGLYSLNGNLNFFGSAGGTGNPITPSSAGDPYHEVVLTRDNAGEVVGYVNGTEQLRFDDAAGAAVIHPGRTLRFFKDDDSVSGEESAGAVAAIRLYDGPIAGPPPELGKTVDASVASGTVLVAVPAGGGSAQAAQKGVRFVPLEKTREIPVGSLLDTRRGTVRLTSARDTLGRTQTGSFASGLFQVLQSRKRSAKGLTDVVLKGGSFKRCGARRSSRATASQRSRRTVRRLRSNARGRFRTRGRHSAATVRGTVWTTTDRCDGTLTKVRRGRVAVRDLRRRRTIVVRAGRSYLARARR